MAQQHAGNIMSEIIHAVYTRDAAKRLSPAAFRKLRTCEPGSQRCIVGRVLADHRTQQSFLVVRVRQRRPVVRMNLQHVKLEGISTLAPRTYHQVSSTTYMAATIDWDTGQVCELSAWPTQREAQQAAKLLHRAAQ